MLGRYDKSVDPGQIALRHLARRALRKVRTTFVQRSVLSNVKPTNTTIQPQRKLRPVQAHSPVPFPRSDHSRPARGDKSLCSPCHQMVHSRKHRICLHQQFLVGFETPESQDCRGDTHGHRQDKQHARFGVLYATDMVTVVFYFDRNSRYFRSLVPLSSASDKSFRGTIRTYVLLSPDLQYAL